MEYEQEILRNFMQLHAHKIKLNTSTRCLNFIRVAKQNGTIPLDVKFETLTAEILVQSYNMNDIRNRWVFKQLSTYDPAKEIIIGIDFEGIFLSHVVKIVKE